MERPLGRVVLVFLGAGLAAGVALDVAWAWAASFDQHCYDYMNLDFRVPGGYGDDSCYEVGARRTFEHVFVVIAAALIAALAAWAACRFARPARRLLPVLAGTTLGAFVTGMLVLAVPFQPFRTALVPPPWWPAPVTPPIWLPPLALMLAFGVAALLTAPDRMRVWIGAGLAAVLVTASLAALRPVGVAWQRHTDVAVCPEAALHPTPDEFVWC